MVRFGARFRSGLLLLLCRVRMVRLACERHGSACAGMKRLLMRYPSVVGLLLLSMRMLLLLLHCCC